VGAFEQVGEHIPLNGELDRVVAEFDDEICAPEEDAPSIGEVMNAQTANGAT
jgi:hypothetical protein